jgi:hypothetical protein
MQDLLAVGLATIVAASALNRRREQDEVKSFLEARVSRLTLERDIATAALGNAQTRLEASAEVAVTEAEAGRGWLSAASPQRADAIRTWIRAAFEDAAAKHSSACGAKFDATDVSVSGAVEDTGTASHAPRDARTDDARSPPSSRTPQMV